MDQQISTRKVEIYVLESDKDKKDEYYKKLRDWNYQSRCYSNDIINMLQSIRIIENFNKNNDSENAKTLEDFLDTSRRNVGYKLVSDKYKELPSYIRSSVNNYVFNDFKNTIGDILRGNRTVTSYKKGMPVFFMSTALRNLKQEDNKFTFDFLGIPMATKLGRDRSNNKEIISRIISGEYKMSDSSFQIKDGKMFLNIVFKSPKKKISLDKDKILGVDLGINFPAYIAINSDSNFRMSIGDRDSFLNQRLGMQKMRRNIQKTLKVSCGGKGRAKKMKKFDSIGTKERNFATTMNHNFSKHIIEAAIKNNCGTINIEDLSGISKNEKNNFVLRNWSYFQLQEMIKYKADKAGIEINVINPQYSSQRCSKCGYIEKENRETQSKFICKSCGVEENADYNAAKNISMAHTKDYKKQIDDHKKKFDKKEEELLAQ